MSESKFSPRPDIRLTGAAAAAGGGAATILDLKVIICLLFLELSVFHFFISFSAFLEWVGLCISRSSRCNFECLLILVGYNKKSRIVFNFDNTLFLFILLEEEPI